MSVEQILFRAKRLVDGQWVTGLYVRGALLADGTVTNHAIQKIGAVIPEEMTNNSYYPEAVDPNTVCQYRSGIDAFDGDEIKGSFCRPEDGEIVDVSGIIMFDGIECMLEVLVRDNPVLKASFTIGLSHIQNVSKTGKNKFDNPDIMGRYATDTHGNQLFSGDKIVCVNSKEQGDTSQDWEAPLEKGRTYTVDEVYDEESLTSPMVVVSGYGTLFPERFLKV